MEGGRFPQLALKYLQRRRRYFERPTA